MFPTVEKLPLFQTETEIIQNTMLLSPSSFVPHLATKDQTNRYFITFVFSNLNEKTIFEWFSNETTYYDLYDYVRFIETTYHKKNIQLFEIGSNNSETFLEKINTQLSGARNKKIVVRIEQKQEK